MPVFQLYYPEKQKRWTVELAGERFVIGRSREAQICIPLTSVSKQHALIERKGDRYHYRDLGSKNGLYLNGFRLDKGTLDEGDELRVGSVLVTFHAAATPTPAPSPGPAAATAAAPAPFAEGPPPEMDAPFDGSATIALPADVIEALEEAREQPVDEPTPPDSEAPESVSPRRRAAPPRPQLEPRRFSAKALAIGMVFALGAGFALGHLASLLDPPPGAEPVPAAALPGAAAAADAPPPAPTAPAGPARLANPLGTADRSQPETARRLCVRLFLDLAERPPTAAELKRIVALGPEKQWDAIRSQAAAPFDPPAARLESACEKLIGRPPTPGEQEQLRQLSEDDPSWYTFHVGTSAEYARADRRRQRSDRQLARSLVVDLTGETPTAAEEKTLLAGLETARREKGAPTLKVARAIIEANRGAGVAPPAGAAPADWLDDLYARLLLRSPTAEEKQKSLAALGKGEGSWKAVLLELVTRPEYLQY